MGVPPIAAPENMSMASTLRTNPLMKIESGVYWRWRMGLILDGAHGIMVM